MRFAVFVGICLGVTVAANPDLARPLDGAVPQPPALQPAAAAPPAPPRAETSVNPPGEISHEEMMKEQERRDREADEERDRDDQ